MTHHKLTICLLATLLAPTFLSAQKLRRGIESADVVVVGRAMRVVPFKKTLLHRIRIDEVLKGKEFLQRTVGGKPQTLGQVAVVEIKGLSEHARPTPAERRLYCLQSFQRRSKKAGLPEKLGPYFKMNGFIGSNPRIGDVANKDPFLGFARILVDAEKGVSPEKIAERLFQVGILGHKQVRTEAIEVLAERQTLQRYLTEAHVRTITNKAVGEDKDIPFKIALASLSATKKPAKLVDTLCICTRDTGDERFLHALGRITRYLHREDAAKVLMPHVREARGATRDRLLLTLGATSTESGLQALLAMRSLEKDTKAVDAALRVHGSPRALAVLKKKLPPAKKKPKK